MQPGDGIMTSIQMWKVHQFNTLTAPQKMTASRRENISHDNTPYCMWKEWIIKHNAIWAEEGFFPPLTNFIFRMIVMPKASILFYLKNILMKVKRQSGLNWQLKHKWSFPSNPGDAAAHLSAIIWEYDPQAWVSWFNPEEKDRYLKWVGKSSLTVCVILFYLIIY